MKRANRINKSNVFKAILCLLIAAFMVLMLLKPEFYLNSALYGLNLYAVNVLPSLFPFYFFSLMLTFAGAVKATSGIFGKPIRFLYNTPKESAYVMLLSFLSGYPVGASMTYELYEAGIASKRDVKTMAAFASTSGPIFILGTVGSAIFDDVRIGIIVLISHYLSAILNGLIFKNRKNKRDLTGSNQPEAKPTVSLDGDDILGRAITKSTASMLTVGGFIVIAGMLIDTLYLLKLDVLLERALGEAFTPVFAVIAGSIEMTRGNVILAEVTNIHLKTALSAFIISLGGLSVTLQCYNFLSKCDMSFFSVVLRKLTQSIIACVIAFAISFTL